MGRSGEQVLYLIPRESAGELLFAAEHGVDDFAFALLKLKNLLLDRVARDELVAGDDPCLPDSMRAVGGLIFDGGIPPRIEVNHGVCSGKVQTYATRLKADEEHGNGRRVLKAADDCGAIAGRAVEVTEFNVLGGELRLDDREHRDELAEHEHAMAAIDDFLEKFGKEFEFAGGERVMGCWSAGVLGC